MLNYVITVAISAFFVPHYVGGLFWEPLRSGPADIFAGALIIVVLAAINVRGAKESAGLNIALAVVDFMTQVLLVGVGIALVLNVDQLTANVTLGVAPTWKNFLLAIPIGMVAYTGIETISNLAEEAKDEATTIPAAISRVRLAVFAIYFTLPAVALSALPVYKDAETHKYVTKLGLPEDKGGFAGDPILGVVQGLHLGPLEGAGKIYVGLLAATILFIATNAGLIGVSRLVYSMGIHRQVPDRLRRLHPRYGTPWIGILVFGGVAIVTLIPGKADFLSKMYAFGAMLSFTIAHVSVIRLRKIQPDFARPYTGPGNARFRGYSLPLFAVLGGIGTAISFVVVTALTPVVLLAGTVWLVLGIGLYVVYRRNQGLDLTTTVKVVIPRPVTDTEAEYESVLVALDARHYSPQTIATAAKLAGPRRRGIHVLVTITVPYAAPMGEQLPEEELAAMGVIEQAKQQGGRRVTGHIEKVRPGGTGRLIVDEARQMSASVIVMPLPPRTGTTLFGKTVETVLSERPCRVIIQSEPSSA
jgi:APA family basic amino acid/polyamine antiporter